MNNISKKQKSFFFILLVFVTAALHIVLKIEHFDLSISSLSFHSDNAIYMLMAEEIIKGEGFPIFFYGQNYMGPLNVWIITINQIILNLLNVTQLSPINQSTFVISPLASLLALTQMTLFGALFFSLGIKNIFGYFWGSMTFIFGVLANEEIARMSLRPNGPENAYLIGSLIFFFFSKADFNFFEKKKHSLILGLLIGFGWWMNQSIVFLVGAILLFLILRDHELLELKNRLFQWYQGLSLRSSKIFTRLSLFVIFLGLIFCIPGKINTVLWGIKLKMSSGFGTIKTGIAVFILSHLIILFLDKKELFYSSFKTLTAKFRVFFIGLVLGYSPVISGKLFKWYETAYKPKIQIIPLLKAPEYWFKLAEDFLPRVMFGYLTEYSFLFSILAIVIFGLFLWNTKKIFKSLIKLNLIQFDKKAIVFIIFALNIFYVMISERSRDQYAIRYALFLIPLIPVILFQALKNKYLLGISLILSFSLSFNSFVKTNNDLKRFTYDKNLFNDSKSLGCNVIYADYWDTYLYEYLTNHELKFIVYESQDRTPKLTKQRSSIQPKCLYKNRELKLLK